MKTLSVKQKTLTVITVLAVAFLIWQIVELVSSSSSTTAPAMVVSSSQPQAAHQTLKPQTALVKVAPASTNQLTIQHDAPPLASNQHSDYEKLSSQIELLKMHHDVLQQQLAIAQMHKQLQLLGGEAALAKSVSTAETSSAPGRVLRYLAKKNGRWEALIDNNGEFETIHLGDHLANGARVVAISAKGVRLQNTNGMQLLDFKGFHSV